MIAHEIIAHLRMCCDGKQSIEDFEEWFDSASWNIHRFGIEPLTNAVFEIEAVLSKYIRGQVEESAVRASFVAIGIGLQSALVALSPSMAHAGSLSIPRIFDISYGYYRKMPGELVAPWKGITMYAVVEQTLELSCA